MRFLKKQWFLVGLILAITVASLSPNFGVMLSFNGVSSTIIIILMFLITGISLPVEKMVDGLKQIKVHIFVQFFIFIFTPLYFFFTSNLIANHIPENFRVGIYALGVLPTTISSCIVFSQLTGGNFAATIFNAVFANFVGVLLSPILLTLLLNGSGNSIPIERVVKIILGLSYKVLVPFIIGQLLHNRVADFVNSNKKMLSNISTILILFIVYFAFSKAAQNSLLRSSLNDLPIGIAYLAISHLVLLGIIYGGTVIFKFSQGDKIAAIFPASQKTLAIGIPLITTFFADKPELLGVALLPNIFYHIWQVTIAGTIVYPLMKEEK